MELHHSAQVEPSERYPGQRDSATGVSDEDAAHQERMPRARAKLKAHGDAAAIEEGGWYGAEEGSCSHFFPRKHQGL